MDGGEQTECVMRGRRGDGAFLIESGGGGGSGSAASARRVHARGEGATSERGRKPLVSSERGGGQRGEMPACRS
jgi:hypothetical protein